MSPLGILSALRTELTDSRAWVTAWPRGCSGMSLLFINKPGYFMGQLTLEDMEGKFQHCARMPLPSSSLCSPHCRLSHRHCLNPSWLALLASAVWLFDYDLALSQTTGEPTSQWLKPGHDYSGFILVGPLFTDPLVLECSDIVWGISLIEILMWSKWDEKCQAMQLIIWPIYLSLTFPSVVKGNVWKEGRLAITEHLMGVRHNFSIFPCFILKWPRKIALWAYKSIYRKGTEKLIKFPLVAQQTEEAYMQQSLWLQGLFLPLQADWCGNTSRGTPSPSEPFFPFVFGLRASALETLWGRYYLAGGNREE